MTCVLGPWRQRLYEGFPQKRPNKQILGLWEEWCRGGGRGGGMVGRREWNLHMVGWEASCDLEGRATWVLDHVR